ncbi:hypothetical protein GMMP15_640027 [Candidatus Magnetomoraceae bacterium gMMP-15]
MLIAIITKLDDDVKRENKVIVLRLNSFVDIWSKSIYFNKICDPAVIN